MSANRKNMKLYSNRYSWEEEAFAEDGRGPLGGFIWPPRFYSCSFCARKFKSAQALGGHMNVHRREKAKFNQTDEPQNQLLHYQDPKGLCPSRGPAALAGQDHSSTSTDTKSSCVYDIHEDLLANGTNLVLGFDLESCWNMVGKNRKTNDHVSPAMMIMQDGLDLELRLAIIN